MFELLMVSRNDSNLLENINEQTREKVSYKHYPDLISALKEISTTKFNILILDYDDMNDYSNRSMFISESYSKNLYIIALTSDESLENIRTIKEKNIHEIILKPIDNNRLNKILHNLIFFKDKLANNYSFN